MTFSPDHAVWKAILEAEPALAALFPRQPAYRYWTDDHGARFCWTTERMSDSKFAAFIYKPVGKGSRIGNARNFKKAREVHFTTRKAAKARAQKWLNASYARDRQKPGWKPVES